MSPTQLTIRELKKRGWTFVRVVEKWNQWAKIRQDLFGFDVIALRDNAQIWVQATSYSNVSARVAKLKAMPEAMMVRNTSANIQCVVWGWFKNKSKRYELKREVVL